MFKILGHTSYGNKKIFVIITCLFVIFVIDTAFVQTYDLTNKQDIPIQIKNIIFSLNISICLALQFFIIQYSRSLASRRKQRSLLSLELFEILGRAGYIFNVLSISFLIFQIHYFEFYYIFILILVIAVTYGISSILLAKTAVLFLSWFRQTRNLLILMYFFSISLILFSLIVTNVIVTINLNERPEKIREYAGGSVDITGGRYDYLFPLYKITSIVSFVSIWLTTAILMYSSKDRFSAQVKYWIMPIILLTYFLTSYFGPRNLQTHFASFNTIQSHFDIHRLNYDFYFC